MPSPVKKAAAQATARAALADSDVSAAPPPIEDEDAPVLDTVEATVRAELAKAGKQGTVLGQAALVLARRLDLPSLDTGSAIAALVKQLAATLDAALADAEEDVDELEMMRRRKQEKLASG